MDLSQHASRWIKGLSLAGRRRLWVISFLLLVFASQTHAEQITLNLNDADITALIKTVSEHTGINFVVDPRVKGKVTVISAHPMEQEEFYQVFLSILEVHGFSTIPSGNVTKVVPDIKAKQSGIPTMDKHSDWPKDQMITRIVKVQNVAAAQLVPILRPLVPQEGHLAAYPSTNVLIISDRQQNVDRLLLLIDQIDQVSDSTVEVIPLQHASAAEVVRIFDGLKDKTGKGADEPIKLVADERTNSILLSGDPSERLKAKVVIQHLDTPFESEGNAQVVYLKYANAADMVPVLTGVTENLDKAAGNDKVKNPNAMPIFVQADEASNALIISAPPDIYRSLQSIIRKLDIRRAQVLVEAIIAEVRTDRVKELGVQWIVDGTPGGSGPVGVINLGSPKISDIAAAIVTENPAVSIPAGTMLGIGDFDNKSVNFAALVRALESDSSTNILSTPSILTLDNQEAEIVIGQNVPFVTGSFTNTGTSGSAVNPFQTVERQDVGLTLRVTPQINEGSAVQMIIEHELSSVNVSASTSASDLITNKRSIKTAVMVENGNTIVLGGLISDDLQQVEEKVPFLGELPLIGALFRSNSTTKVKQNLMVFLRPVIVRDAATETAISDAKYNYFRAQQLRLKEQGVDLMDDEESPLLPERFNQLAPPFEPLTMDERAVLNAEPDAEPSHVNLP